MKQQKLSELFKEWQTANQKIRIVTGHQPLDVTHLKEISDFVVEDDFLKLNTSTSQSLIIPFSAIISVETVR